jgi:putative transposase
LGRKPRQDRGQYRSITPQLAELIERLKRENPHRAGTTLLRELALRSGSDSAPIAPATLYRFLQQRALTTRQLQATPGRKKFEAEFSNQVWQSDLLFGPYVQRPGGGRMQAFLFAVLDDASRLVPHAQFYDNQGLDAFLDCLRHAVASRGVPIKLYVDNGKVYRSEQLARLAASLGILITHSSPYQPEGRGKIERFFRTVREQFLANLEELNERLWTWIEQVYHRSQHASLGTTPLLRWQRDIDRDGNFVQIVNYVACFSIAWIATYAVIPLSCCKSISTKSLPIWPGKPWKCVLIPWISRKWKSSSRDKPRVGRALSIPW